MRKSLVVNTVLPNLFLNMTIGVIVFTMAVVATSANARHDQIELAPDLVETADTFLGARFTNINSYCDHGVLPWSRAALSNLKEFILVVYKYNWLAGVFDVHATRVAALFSDEIMRRYLSTTLSDYSENNVQFFFYNLNRCWSQSKSAEQIFGALIYILNHHYSEIDVCLDTYHARYADCALANEFLGGSDEPIVADMHELYKKANGINDFIRDHDAHGIWLKQLRDGWLSTTTLQEFREMKAEKSLPVVDIKFAVEHIDALISHYEQLR